MTQHIRYPLSQETKGRDSTGNPLMEGEGRMVTRWFWNSKAMKTSCPLGGGLNVSIVAPRVGPLMANALQFACVEVWIAMWLFWWQKPSCIQCVNNILHTTHWASTNEWHFRLLLNKTKDFHKWCHRTLLKIKVLLVSMVLWRTLNILGTFQMMKRFFIVKKGSLDF